MKWLIMNGSTVFCHYKNLLTSSVSMTRKLDFFCCTNDSVICDGLILNKLLIFSTSSFRVKVSRYMALNTAWDKIQMNVNNNKKAFQQDTCRPISYFQRGWADPPPPHRVGRPPHMQTPPVGRLPSPLDADPHRQPPPPRCRPPCRQTLFWMQTAPVGRHPQARWESPFFLWSLLFFNVNI